MPTKAKIHFDVNSVPCDRFEHDPSDVTLCGMKSRDSEVTPDKSRVTCRSCLRSKYFRANFSDYAIPPTDAEVQRSRKWRLTIDGRQEQVEENTPVGG